MDELQISRALSENVKTKNKFLGVFSSDLIPSSIQKFPACFVANTEKSDQEGSHWVAFYIESPTKLCFFDSFGNPPTHFTGGIAEFSNTYDDVEFNPKKLQSNMNFVCGHYCLYYLFEKCIDRSSDDIFLSYEPYDSCNDIRVRDIVTELFGVEAPFSE